MKILARIILLVAIVDLYTLIRGIIEHGLFNISNLIGVVLITASLWFFERYRNGINEKDTQEEN
jgi:hypothetical protein